MVSDYLSPVANISLLRSKAIYFGGVYECSHGENISDTLKIVSESKESVKLIPLAFATPSTESFLLFLHIHVRSRSTQPSYRPLHSLVFLKNNFFSFSQKNDAFTFHRHRTCFVPPLIEEASSY